MVRLLKRKLLVGESIYGQAIQYELLTQRIYQEILIKEGLADCVVEHNISVTGRSGVSHQIDVSWQFKQAGVAHRVLIECKNYSSTVDLGTIRNFHSVVQDITNCVGVMVSKVGFQSGAVEFSQHHGISLKLLRQPIDEDWNGRIRQVVLRGHMRVPEAIVCTRYFRASSEQQHQRLLNAFEKNPEFGQGNGASLRFLDSNGAPATAEMRWWVPRQLNVLDFEDGGPYKKPIELKESYLWLDMESGAELVQVIGVVLEFCVVTSSVETLAYDAAETVTAILKDFESGEWEHIYGTPR